MTIQAASERYQIPMNVLREYESWGLCGAVKKVMGAWQYDDSDLERLSVIMTLHDIGFCTEEVETYMRLLLEGKAHRGRAPSHAGKEAGCRSGRDSLQGTAAPTAGLSAPRDPQNAKRNRRQGINDQTNGRKKRTG